MAINEFPNRGLTDARGVNSKGERGMEKTKWYERLFGKKLIKCDAVNSLNDFDLIPTNEVLKTVSITGIYFSFANINLQSDDLIKKLRDLYDRLRNESGSNEKKLEVVQVVMWAHNDNYGDFESSHRESLLGLPWFAMPFSEIDLKNLKESCGNSTEIPGNPTGIPGNPTEF
ncbi:hypothetical protein NQ317_018384 [Molorchus minor]|uniref:Uncharacterized protein n=1 Tax=Molorchus minor TaxID=1323400 RepID=A0ABQ9JFL1_9CUCU|nr:hypothetical protein NQ317_018384 [Molorchus minor]